MANNVVRGVDVLIKVKTGTGTLVPVGFQRGGTLNREAETIDMTSKDNYGWSDVEYGVRSWSVDCDGIYAEGNQGLQLLEDAFMNRETVDVEVTFPNGSKKSGKAIITSFPIEMGYEDVATYSMTLVGKGALTETDVTP